MSDDDEDDGAPGWDAISAALERLYPDQAGRHYGPTVHYAAGGPDPIDGMDVFERSDPRPHWHIVTYGFSDLYSKGKGNPDRSGFGFELTMRVARDAGDDTVPLWALQFLQKIAGYVFRTGNVLKAGDYMPINVPFAEDTPSDLVGVAFAGDEELEAIDTPFGRVAFIQLVGVTADELQAIRRWNAQGLLDALRPHLPALVTDLGRSSLLGDAALAAEVEAGSRRDGSSTAFLLGDQMQWKTSGRLLRQAGHTVTLGAGRVDDLVAMLPLRLLFDEPLIVGGTDQSVVLRPGALNAVEEKGNTLTLRLDADTVRALAAALRAVPGRYEVPGLPVTWTVVERASLTDAG